MYISSTFSTWNEPAIFYNRRAHAFFHVLHANLRLFWCSIHVYRCRIRTRFVNYNHKLQFVTWVYNLQSYVFRFQSLVSENLGLSIINHRFKFRLDCDLQTQVCQLIVHVARRIFFKIGF